MREEIRLTRCGFSAKLRRWAGRVTSWLAVILIGLFLGREAIRIGSTIDVSRLVPISVNNVFQAIILAVSLYPIGIILTGLRKRPKGRLALFTIAFALRVTIGIALGFLFQYDDEIGFHLAGLKQQYGLFSWDVGHGYYHLVNILYALFGPNLLLPKIINAFLGSLLPFFAYDLGQKLFNDPKVAWRAFWFTAFLPPLVLYSAVNLKEIATAFLFVLTLWFLAMPRQYTVRKIIGAMAPVGLLYWLRGTPWAAIAVTGVITYFVLGESWRFRDLLRVRSWPKIAFVVILFTFFASPFIIRPITQMALHRLTPGTYFTERFGESKATVMQFVSTSSPLSPKNLGVLFLRGLFSPSPLRFFFNYNLGTLLESINMLVWYILFPFAVIGFWVKRRKGAVVTCGVMALAVLAMATTGIMVGSDPYRHRMDMFGLLFILSAGALTGEKSHGYKWILCLWLIGSILFTILWMLLRI